MDTKKLRQKILDLAIRGKLVPQDPNDEPASVLLECIRAEKERLIKEGKIKRSKKSASDTPENEVPFEIPESWEWVTIEELLINRDSERIPLSLATRKKQINKIYEYYGAAGVIDKVDNYLFSERLLLIGEDGANLLSRSKNNAFFAEGKYWVNNHAHVLDCSEKFVLDYVAFVINSMSLEKYVTGSAQPKLTQDNLNKILIPLPPQEEQKRIINGVEYWFALIDILDNEKDDLQASIQQAKSKILDLAIHGKLVPQDPNDEPAIELLKRINPKFEACDNVLDTTQLPDSWCWTKLESISTDSADGPFGSNLKKEHYTTNKEVRIIQLSNIGDEGWREENTKYTTFEHLKDISRSEVLPNDIVIAKMMPAGRAILCPNNEHKYVLSSDAVKFHIVDNIDCRYILYAINSDMFRKQVYENVQGVTRVRTSLQKLRKYCLPLPPNQEQLRIVAKIEELFSVLDSIKESLA